MLRAPMVLSSGLLVAVVLAHAVPAQGTLGVSERFAKLQPARSKTFVRGSSDPDERPNAPSMGNDDGFSGVNHCEAYREISGLDEIAVLTDVQGRAGFMGLFFRNFWSGLAGVPVMAQEYNRTQILIDGVMQHDMLLTDYFRNPSDPGGQIPPFTGPFTGHRAGGHLTHTPLTWQQSFKVQVIDNSFDNAGRFHKVAGTLMAPEQLADLPDLPAWETVYQRIGTWRHSVPRQPVLRKLQIHGGNQSRSIALHGGGALLELRCRIDQPDQWNNIVLRCYWDGSRTASVDVPLRFLGGMVRQPFSHALDTLFFGNNGTNEIWCYYPMPFRDSAQLEFVNVGSTEVQLDVTTSTWSGVYPEPFGYFSAQYQRAITQTGVSFRGPQIVGQRGVLRAIALEDGEDTTGRIQGIDLMHLEGDLCVRINGNRGDDHIFEASETSIGKWGWYGSPSDVPFAQDGSFNTSYLVDFRNGIIDLDRMQGSTFVFDPIQFVDGIDIVLEHGIQNLSNADYRLFTVFYLQPDAARVKFGEIDVGDTTDEANWNVRFGAAPTFNLTATFFRDHFFGSAPLTDEGREVQNWYRFTASAPNLAAYQGVCVGFRLDRPRIGDGGIVQARLYVDGVYAGLLHSATSNALNRWKEGGELEVELPRSLTDGKSSFLVEVRPVAGSEPLRIGAIQLYGYTRN